jgi:hypothetical protein
MTRKETVSNVTAAELARVISARAANLPPPAVVKELPPGGTLCRYAEDTGEFAFPNLPCRGHRIECRKTGVVTFAANCRPDKCNYFEDKETRG